MQKVLLGREMVVVSLSLLWSPLGDIPSLSILETREKRGGGKAGTQRTRDRKYTISSMVQSYVTFWDLIKDNKELTIKGFLFHLPEVPLMLVLSSFSCAVFPYVALFSLVEFWLPHLVFHIC